MQASHLRGLGGGPSDPQLCNREMIRRTSVGSRAGTGTGNRAIPARRPQPVIDRGFRFATANEAYRYPAEHRYVGEIVRSGD